VKLVKSRKNSTAVTVDKAKDVRVSIGLSGIGGKYQREG
jgi:hypothetical protein